LHQVNYLGKAADSEAVVAGMVVRLSEESGSVYVRKGASASPAPINAVYGFAINNQTAGDVIESGVIGVYALDGHSVIETDQAKDEITSSTYPVGAPLTAEAGTGLVKVVTVSSNAPATTDKIIGYVEGIRQIPGRTQTVTNPVTGRSTTVQGVTTVLGIKLAS
jgi:hypothetical protein